MGTRVKKKMRQFRGDESGAITADYVVLAGAIVALGLAAANAVRLGTFSGADDVSDAVKTSGCVVTGESGTTDLTNCN